MKNLVRLLAAAFLSLLIATPAFADKKTPTPSPVSAAINARQDEAAYTQQLTDYYKKEAAERKIEWAKRTDLLKQVTTLREKMTASKDAAEKKKLIAQMIEINQQLGAHSEAMAKRDISNAEFGLKAAERRLEKSKENLTRIQESNKKLPKS